MQKKITFLQTVTGFIYLVSGRRIALGPVRKANDRRWAEKVVRNQEALDKEHEKGLSVRFIDKKAQRFTPFSSNPNFKPAVERD